MSVDTGGVEKQHLPGKTLVTRLSLFRLKIFEVLAAMVEAESITSFNGKPIAEGIFNSTIQILIIWAVDMTHNSIFMCKFVQFFKLYLAGSSAVSLCNSLIRTGALDYMCEAFGEWVCHGRTTQYTVSQEIIPWLKDLIMLVHESTLAPEHKMFAEEIQHVTKWRYAYYLATTTHQGEVPSIHEYIDEEIRKRMIAVDLQNRKSRSSKLEPGTGTRTIGSIVKVQKAGKTLLSTLNGRNRESNPVVEESKDTGSQQVFFQPSNTPQLDGVDNKDQKSVDKQRSNSSGFKISKVRSESPLRKTMNSNFGSLGTQAKPQPATKPAEPAAAQKPRQTQSPAPKLASRASPAPAVRTSATNTPADAQRTGEADKQLGPSTSSQVRGARSLDKHTGHKQTPVGEFSFTRKMPAPARPAPV